MTTSLTSLPRFVAKTEKCPGNRKNNRTCANLKSLSLGVSCWTCYNNESGGSHEKTLYCICGVSLGDKETLCEHCYHYGNNAIKGDVSPVSFSEAPKPTNPVMSNNYIQDRWANNPRKMSNMTELHTTNDKTIVAVTALYQVKEHKYQPTVKPRHEIVFDDVTDLVADDV